ncbi:hypothetical protein Halru_2799 [Halovivax ruber XH-70]|uniref:Uncharacterized protein n=1 Tax=Halovivax ruber (strain DSM 18193 / JCM 13892 / XH-70) TaxID=797302 RepID=L0ICV1_HALRX|nr:hypothetical protein [Halovivax ruber]AGB17370.1 hypothetical protein Halru_2799 [Halovivax ruber XH-70]
MSPEIVFGEDRKEYLADLFNKIITDEGYLRDRNSGEIVKDDNTGKKLTIEDLGIVYHGSEHYVKDDVGDILHYTTEVEE